MTPKRMRGGGRAFTLVELLVVVGLIAVLIGILMPALAAARAQARAVACLSNVRQIAMAAIQYVQEHKTYVTWSAGSDRKELLYPYLKQGKDNNDNAVRQVWHCPANERPEQEASYGFNTYLNGVRITKIRRWSETVALCDAGLADQPAPGTASMATHCWPPSRLATASSCRPNHLRHPNATVMVGFVDGHAERLTMILPFYPGPVGTWTGNNVTDPASPDYVDGLWDLN